MEKVKYCSNYKTADGAVNTYYFTDKEHMMNNVMFHIFTTLGNGDGENGGKGSLWHCAGEIYDILESGKHYSYADKEWWTEKME